MIRLIQWLIHGHSHKWETTHIDEFTHYNRRGKVISVGDRHRLKCKTCGEVKKVDLI